MKLSLLIILLAMISCSKDVLVTDYIEVTLKDNSKDTIVNTYWNEFQFDPYVLEWMYKQNNINPVNVKEYKIVRKTKKKVRK